MRIYILGASGMLGHQVLKIFSSKFKNVMGMTSNTIDLRSQSNIHRLGDFLNKDDLIINCCGILRQRLPKKCSAFDTHVAFMLNSYLPLHLSTKCNLIHISTDCVFSGEKGNYIETDLPDAEDVYGRTKALGDPIEEAFIMRTSIVGKELNRKLGLYSWFLRQKWCQGFVNHFWNGMTTNQLAECIFKIVNDGTFKQVGLYHVFSDTVSKFELLNCFNLYRENAAEIEPVEADKSVDRTLSTTKEEFLYYLGIKPLAKQIEEMSVC